jgi:hypothetical protein
VTIFVDSAMIQATVGRHTSRWCHLMSDQLDPTELHEFAARIGLRRSYFQPGKRLGSPTEHDPVGDHYDVTEGKRRQAIAAGAVALDQDGFLKLMRIRRELAQAERELSRARESLAHVEHGADDSAALERYEQALAVRNARLEARP